MAFFSSLPDRLCEWLADKRDLSDCHFCTQYPSGFKSIPLTKPIVFIGTKSVDVVPCSPENAHIRDIEEKYTIGIHVPRSMGGVSCTKIFHRIAEQLLFNCDIFVSRMTAHSVEYVRETDSLFMNTEIEIHEQIEKGYDSNYSDRFVI